MTLADLVSEAQQEQSAPTHFIALSDIHIMHQSQGLSRADGGISSQGGGKLRPYQPTNQ
jgi:hypothetical protein